MKKNKSLCRCFRNYWRKTNTNISCNKLRSANNLMIAERVGLPINSVTPRVKELRDLGVVRAHHKAYCPKTQRLTIFWKPRIWDF